MGFGRLHVKIMTHIFNFINSTIVKNKEITLRKLLKYFRIFILLNDRELFNIDFVFMNYQKMNLKLKFLTISLSKLFQILITPILRN